MRARRRVEAAVLGLGESAGAGASLGRLVRLDPWKIAGIAAVVGFFVGPRIARTGLRGARHSARLVLRATTLLLRLRGLGV